MMDKPLRSVKGVVGQDGLWVSPTVPMERDVWVGEGVDGGQTQEGSCDEPTLDELLDMELRKMSMEAQLTSAYPHSSSSSPSPVSPMPNGVLAAGEGDRGAPVQVLERESGRSAEPTSRSSDPPICQREEGRSDAKGAEGDGEPEERQAEEKFTGHDGGEGPERERDQEDENRSRGSEGDEDARMQGASGSRRPAGGKRGRRRSPAGGREQGQLPASSSSSSSTSSSKPSAPSGPRHKQSRRRNNQHHQHARAGGCTAVRIAGGCRRVLSQSLRPWCMSCLRVVVELIVLVTHRCGEVVEASGAALYQLGSQLLCKASDLPAIKAEAGLLLIQARCRGRALAAWVTGTAKQCHQVAASCLCLALVAVRLGSACLGRLLGRLAGERGQRWWAALQGTRIWGSAVGLWEKFRTTIWGGNSQASSSTPKSPCGAGRVYPGQELERLLALAHVPEEELDPFAVLGVEASATDPELKRAYRQLAVLVHPDKNKHPRAGEAFKVLRAAWDIVSNPETRRAYELKRMAETELSKSMNEFLTKLQDDLKEAMNTMMCTKCEGKHRRFEMERDPSEARFCAECNKRHGAEEGDLWAESSMLGLRITYFAFIDGKVYDITEWAGCQRIRICPDTHRVPYHITFSSRNSSGGAARHRSPSEPPPAPSSPADLQDFFNRIFQGVPPSGMAANGGFFPSAPSHHQPPGASPGAGGHFSAPPGPGRPFTDGSGPRTEGAKLPRRRKKVRRSFPR
ncbi:hypothetical protein MATL_G00104190 [Megalops atlanticus]|uniref:J domain-containing protein n=1 Tax=Megalops atlanticus TaxID=7932 RepID=A0A9D3Q3L0_MEGAT|nr:hypothetical protein MATL_G00104190 [Megalops atlanticus]